MSIILIGGGTRSGKSAQALKLAKRYGPRRGFLATAQAFDEEMRVRIARHQAERQNEFQTIEEPLHLADAVQQLEASLDVLIVDCLTLWLSNAMHVEPSIPLEPQLDRLAASPLPCLLVTNEVGCGIVPDNALAREFRDRAGFLNQYAAGLATEVYFMAFGLPLQLK